MDAALPQALAVAQVRCTFSGRLLTLGCNGGAGKGMRKHRWAAQCWGALAAAAGREKVDCGGGSGSCSTPLGGAKTARGRAGSAQNLSHLKRACQMGAPIMLSSFSLPSSPVVFLLPSTSTPTVCSTASAHQKPRRQPRPEATGLEVRRCTSNHGDRARGP